MIVSQTGALGTARALTSASPSGAGLPPIILVHGNGDQAALWLTTRWRFESNGVPRDRVFAINFTDPTARDNDAEPQANRSSSEDQRQELAAAIDHMKARFGAVRGGRIPSASLPRDIQVHCRARAGSTRHRP
jgi:Lipase (class 2)